MTTLECKFTGSLLGLAVGDALGAPLEEIPKHPSQVKGTVTEMIASNGWLKLDAGQVTDDTEMMLCIARSIVEKKAFDPQDIAMRFVAWFDDNNISSGSTTRAAIERLKEGYSWYDAGRNEKGLTFTGNGCVMRCTPVALLNYNDSFSLVAQSYDQSRITHPHPDCTGSSIFVNALIARCIASHERNDQKEAAFADAVCAISYNETLQNHYQNIPLHSDKTIRQCISGDVRETVESATYCFLTTTTFEDAVVKAINLRGDADTRGAVVGAIAGAYYGETAIPNRWKQKLLDRHKISLQSELELLGRELYYLSSTRRGR